MQVAVIREAECVGCTKCLAACPVDAIIGASSWLHSVITHECIGCGLCIAPCPMDCIDMVEHPIQEGTPQKLALAQNAKIKYAAKRERILRQKPLALPDKNKDEDYKIKIQAEIQKAFNRVNNKVNEKLNDKENNNPNKKNQIISHTNV